MPRLVRKLPEKRPEDLRMLRIDYSRKLGSQSQGDVYSAKVRFEGGRTILAAAKIYRNPIKDEQIPHYDQVFRMLKEHNIPHIKAGFVRHEGKWVLISHAYARGRKSIANDAFFTNFAGGMLPISMVRCDGPLARKYLDMVSNLINIGLTPEFDSIFVIGSRAPHFKVGDFDALAAQVQHSSKHPFGGFMAWMHLNGLQLRNEADRPEMAKYFLKKLADPSLRAEIRKEMKSVHPDWAITE